MSRLRTHQLATAVATLTAGLLAASFWAERNVDAQFLPHGFCFTWIPGLLWLHVLSDGLIGLAYVSIPVTLLHFVRKREDLPFHWMFVLFALFIVGCGFTHLLGIWTVWNPDYWFSGTVKALTAAVSVLTAVALVFLIPKALALPTVAQLRAAKEALEAEVQTRRAVEEELRRARDALERRVEERTVELSRATALAEQARAEAEAANRMKDQFLAKVSHELRTPLQATQSWVQVLGRGGLDAATQRLALDRIEHNVRTQARLIDDLLDISRILSGKLRLDLAPAEPQALIAKAADIVRPAAAQRGIALELRLDTGGGVTMETDAVRFEQVVWNLISNAVHASPDGGRVCVEAEVAGERLRLRVIDRGRGIEPQELALIFEPFHQGSQGAPGHRGLGLGLAITRSIVEQLGGEIRARSDGSGRGAVFEVELPVRRVVAAATPAAPPSSATQGAPLQGRRILFVEDEADIAAAIGTMLRASGAEVRTCGRYDEALPQVRAADFDLLLSDLNLPGGGSGLDLARELRATPAARHIPAVALSAHGSKEDRRATAAAGFSRHLVKPVDAGELVNTLMLVLRGVAGLR
ncbi:ATP-binding protein [Caldimonas tepidiphila]|uniref:hybrid sensor histidine kinase/response regulator n=1 Tax=Caldimonas tepidiphila TaxID=2315841 RepID=UPI000E5B8751|nr:ATP-binding protein [Caldimonas tepidiphila]